MVRLWGSLERFEGEEGRGGDDVGRVVLKGGVGPLTKLFVFFTLSFGMNIYINFIPFGVSEFWETRTTRNLSANCP